MRFVDIFERMCIMGHRGNDRVSKNPDAKKKGVMIIEKPHEGKPICCDCGKLIAKERDGKIWLFCKKCKKEVELKIVREKANAT